MSKKYVKKDQLSHVLLRPEMYIGAVSLRLSEEYIAIQNKDLSYEIIKKDIKTSPAILRIFIEILSNAIDNYQRSVENKIPCSYIKVYIDKETGETKVVNDGDFIPIKIDETEKMYNHTLIFGNLLSGSNFDDEQDRYVSGRNGIGATACNIFSKKFTIHALDPDNKKTFEQTWTNNMRDIAEPIIGKAKTSKAYTSISYFPDFEKFGLKGYTDDIISQYMKYIIDTSILTKVKVYFNDNLIPVNNLTLYSKLFDCHTDESISFKGSNSECVLTPSKEFEMVTFVNGIFTKLGGTHLDAWSDAIFRPLLEKINKKGKPQLNIKDIKQYFRIFVIATVVNPHFESQSKYKLESPKIEASVKTADIAKIMKWSVVSDIQDIIRSKEMIVLKKSEKKKKGYVKIEGLDNANYAGTKNSHLCSLILCEGLSAKTYAVAGIEKGVYGYTGRNYNGILALGGKLLNCRNSNPSIIAKNKVITDLVQALGLQHGVDYTIEDNYKNLQYGRVILLTDADCFTDDTALLVKQQNKISVIQIDSLFDENMNIDTQLIEDTEVWSDTKWIPIQAIRRKTTNKKILTINTYSGLVRCTEDHTLLLENGDEIKAKDIKIGDRLLRNNDKINYTPINYCNDKKAMLIFRNNNLKKVPDEILNSSLDIQKSFFEGYCDGKVEFEVVGQVCAQGLCYIIKNIGYSYNITEKEYNIFTINVNKHVEDYPGEVKYIYETDYKDRFVYDIETVSGRINAGVGNMIQRQCDGIHISGLIMNFLHALFPSVLKRNEPFLVSMQTPIVRVFNKGGDLLFYDENRFKDYVKKQTKTVKSKYYKGLGTTKIEDVPDTFGEKMVEYVKDDKLDESINKVFHKDFADERKKWLENYNPNPEFSLDDGGKMIEMKMSNFVNNEVIKFSHEDCKRSIPSLFDGLKESQRKLLYSIKKRNLLYSKPSLKVAQLGGYVAEHTNYHHGEQNLYQTIVKMAHEFPGSNNIPLLYRDGQFGSRNDGGSDAASPRYIFTKMESLTPLIFREEDDVLLNYIDDDGDLVEPEFYIPIIPMILVNGCTAIGTGWSSSIPCYNPKDLIECIKIWMEHDGKVITNDERGNIASSLFPELLPWYRGFTGKIETKDNKIITYGNITKEKNKVNITELPIGMWTNKFKEFCEDLIVEKKIKSMNNNSTVKKVNFTLTETEDGLSCNLNNLKLHSYLYTTNMVVFNEKYQLKKYNIDQIINDFCYMRYEFYKKRKQHIIKQLEKELRFLGNKERFITEIINKKLNIMNVDENILIKELEKRGYDKENVKVDDEGEESGGGYNYLLRLPVRTLTSNQVKKIQNDILSLEKKLDYITKISEKKMWVNDLNEFEEEYDKWLKTMEIDVKPKKNKK